MARLFSKHPPNFQTQYAEVKERAFAAGPLLPGTPGTLILRSGTGYKYWYRVYYWPPGKQAEALIGNEEDLQALDTARAQIQYSEWVARQVPILRRLNYQVADKSVARVLVELHNKGAFAGGLILVGTLAYMAWLNELGASAGSARTMDIDVARCVKLKLAAPLAFLPTLQATGLPFTAVGGLDHRELPTSAKLPGAEGLRVDLLVPGEEVGAAVKVPELQWAAQAMPYYEYLLEEPEPAVLLAGWQCIPVKLPQPARMVWHKLYSSIARVDRAKRSKDFLQAMTLAAAVSEEDPVAIRRAFDDAPRSMLSSLAPLKTGVATTLVNHPEVANTFAECLGVRNPKARKSTKLP